MFKPTKGLVVKDWKQDNVSNEFSKASSKEQIPFIEVNGRQFADTNIIIDKLKDMYNLTIDQNLNSIEKAKARAIIVLIEESLFRCYVYNLSQNISWLASDNGFSPHLPAIKKLFFEKIGIKQLQSGMKSRLHAQGYGRLSMEEITEVTKKDLIALSNFLGDKKFLFGDKPSTVDAALFGHLCVILHTPVMGKIIPFIYQSTPNLKEFTTRVKTEYWPDWDILCQNLVLNVADFKREASHAQ